MRDYVETDRDGEDEQSQGAGGHCVAARRVTE